MLDFDNSRFNFPNIAKYNQTQKSDFSAVFCGLWGLFFTFYSILLFWVKHKA